MSAGGANFELIDYLVKSVARLSTENAMLKMQLQTSQNGAISAKTGNPDKLQEEADDLEKPSDPEASVFKEYHLVWCGGTKRNYFRDVPRMFKGDMKSDHLRGLQGIENISKYLEKRKHLAFAVVYQYDCSCAGGPDYHRRVGYKDGKIIDDSPPAECKNKLIVAGEAVKAALKDIVAAHPDRFVGYKSPPSIFHEPYLYFYYLNTTFIELADSSGLDDFGCKSIKLLCNWFEENCRKDWDEGNEMMARGKITKKHYPKLFQPNELTINPRRDRQGLIWVYKIKEYPWDDERDVKMDACWWVYNGSFQKIDGTVDRTNFYSKDALEVTERDGEVDITSLTHYPIRFAAPSVREKLIARGSKFWSCRKKKLISYTEPESEGDATSKPVSLQISKNCPVPEPKSPSWQC